MNNIWIKKKYNNNYINWICINKDDIINNNNEIQSKYIIKEPNLKNEMNHFFFNENDINLNYNLTKCKYGDIFTKYCSYKGSCSYIINENGKPIKLKYNKNKDIIIPLKYLKRFGVNYWDNINCVNTIQ